MLEKIVWLIPEKLKKVDVWIFIVKRIIYITGFTGLCLIDQVIGSATGSIQYGLKNYTGIIIAVIILTAYKIRDFMKLPYFIWTLMFFIGRHHILEWGMYHSGNYLELQTDLWGVGIYGILFIRMLYLFLVERKKPRMNWLPFSIVLVMLGGMAIIRSDLAWPKALLVTFPLLYLTEFQEKDLNNLYAGMADGIILGFFLIQGQAWLYRPYDIVRYQGMYSHPNMNALLYVCAYGAVLCRWYLMKLKRQHIIFRLPYILLAGLILGTIAYTGSRSAVITLVPVTLLFLIFQMLSRRRWKLAEFLIDGIVLAVSVAVCLLPAYWLIRYVPVYGNNPIYFEADTHILDEKIQRDDPADDEKYIEFEEAKEDMYDRFLWFLEEEAREEITSSVSDWLDWLFPALHADAAAFEESADETSQEVYIEPGTDKDHPLQRTFDEELSWYDVRLDIYKYFLKKLSLIGEKDNVQGVWTTEYYFATHCHNLFLQIAYDFGIIIGLLFIGVVIMVYGKVLFGLVRKKSGSWYYRLFLAAAFTTIFVVFGMTEIDWIYGQLPMTMFFVVQYAVYHKRADEVHEKAMVREIV